MIIILAIIVLIINIPFGFWRKSQKKYSLSWFLAIHIPVLISIVLRLMGDIKFEWKYLLIFVAMFFIGQIIGKYIHTLRYRLKTSNIKNEKFE